MASTTAPVERKGSCLCGAIQLTVTGDPAFTNTCHCGSCQKATGSVVATIAVFREEQIKYTFSTPDVMKQYVDGSPMSGNEIYRSFCSNCGSRTKNNGTRFPGMVALPTGVLDDREGLKPQMELFCVNREGWLAAVADSKQFDLMPPPPPTV